MAEQNQNNTPPAAATTASGEAIHALITAVNDAVEAIKDLTQAVYKTAYAKGNISPEQPDLKPVSPGKTTPDEGKTFDKDTVFVCVRDCVRNGTRYRAGDTVTGRKCPPWFEVKPAAPEERKK